MILPMWIINKDNEGSCVSNTPRSCARNNDTLKDVEAIPTKLVGDNKLDTVIR